MSQKHVLSQSRVKVSYSSFRLCNKSGCLELHKPGNLMVNVLLMLHMVEVKVDKFKSLLVANGGHAVNG